MKKFLSIIIILAMCVSSTVFSFASSNVDGYYSWKVTSKQLVSSPYGDWRNGPSGTGPSTLSFTNSDSTSYSIKVTNTITGSYGDLSAIEKSVGVEIGKSISHSVTYTITIPSGKRQQIIYRPHYKRYKIVQTKYFVDHGVSSSTGETKTSYVNVFDSWDYSVKNL